MLRDPSAPRAFLERSVGGWFKGKDPSVGMDVVETVWVEASEIVSIGKATSLRSRLSAYRPFGTGEPVGHLGGRDIWQLADHSELLVAWHPTSDESPRDADRHLIATFVQDNGKRPFAKLRD